MIVFHIRFFYVSSLITPSYLPFLSIPFQMGYAQLSQKGEGIHLRQFSRAFIIEDDDRTRVAFVSFEAGMVGNAVKRAVVRKLQDRYGKQYTMDNVIVSGTHTHSAPGGFLTHLLYDLSTLGFVSETFNAYVDGIYNVSLAIAVLAYS